MRKEFKEAVQEAKRLNFQIDDSAHNFDHTESVVGLALKITKEYSEVDPDLIQVAGWWHDIGRIRNNEEHERVSAEIARDFLEKMKVEREVCEKVYNAIVFHRWSMSPETIEGEIIRDADKLDFISIKRWAFCLEDNNMKVLNDISIRLPRLRDELLHLEISRKIYDEKINIFNKFIEKSNHKNLYHLKSKILNYEK
ncbi:MAG: HD domain-containing protein [Candidatus Pacebacteria bacterium]|nr:HD domain-containing protein [Candidatus Paceibacterota bacterium]